VLLLDLFLEGGLVAALGALLLLDGAARGVAEPALAHRKREPGEQSLEVG
jgi:hypothetical protein